VESIAAIGFMLELLFKYEKSFLQIFLTTNLFTTTLFLNSFRLSRSIQG